MGSLSLLQWIFLTQTGVSCIAGGLFFLPMELSGKPITGMDDLIFILERISINLPKNACTDSCGNIGLSQLLKMFQGQVLGARLVPLLLDS